MTLSHLRVLDLGARASTAWCARLLGDYGAAVIGIEPHPLRSEGPFDKAGRSIPARYFLANRDFADIARVDALTAGANVIITDALTGEYCPGSLAGRNPNAIICAITPYGLDGRLSQWPGNDLTACAASGWASVNGLKGRPPLKSSGYQVSYQAGTFSFGVILAAIIHQLANGSPGQVIDVSEREVLVSTFAPAPLRYQYSGNLVSRRDAVDVNEGPVPVKDGWFALTISRPLFWVKAMEILGLPDLAEDKELQQAGMRHKFKDRFTERVASAMSSWTRMELFDALAERRVIAGPVLRLDELAENPQFLARGFFREGEDGVRYPGPFARMTRTEWRPPGHPPSTLGEFTCDGSIDVKPVRAGGKGSGPLAGFRGLVLTQAWAGTYATELLGLLGADIIQVETRGRLDSWRGSYQNPIPKNLRNVATAKHAWNCSPLYNSVNLNKRCITLDLSEPEGIALFRELVRYADFIAENFSPRVMGNLGIDYDSLKQIKPDIVMAGMSAYGATGPWANVPGIGGTIEPSSGMSALLGYKDEHPMNSGQMYPDPVAGICGMSAILLALLQRDRTGEGQYIDLSMQEANFTFIGDAWLEYELTGKVRGPTGNSHDMWAPHGIYPARGDDQWIALAARTDEQWRAIIDVLNLEPVCMTRPERKANEDDIDRIIASATAGRHKHELAAILCRAGVPAAPVLGANEIAADADLRERGHMVLVHHPETGPMWQSGLAARLDGCPGGVTRPAPLQGEHAFEILSEFVGMDRQTWERLCNVGTTGTGPTDKSTVTNQA